MSKIDKIKITILTAELLDEFAALMDEYRVFYGKQSNHAETHHYVSALSKNANVFILLVLLEDKKPIGFCSLFQSFSSVQAQKILILNDLYIYKNQRRYGYGEQLLDAAIALANKKRINFLKLETAKDNVVVQTIYEKHGWKLSNFLEKMGDVNDRLNDNIVALNQGISSIAEMRDKAENAFPKISNKIDDLVKSVSDSVVSQQTSTSETVKAVEGMATDIKVAVDGARTEIESAVLGLSKAVESSLAEQKVAQTKMLQEIEKSLEGSRTEFNKVITEFGKNVETSLSDQKVAQQQLLDALQISFNDTMGNMSTTLNDSIVKLDEAIQSEIERVVREMSENLAGVTRQFVSDYTPLLEKSRLVLELAKKAERS